MNKNKGFTLIELLAVIVILAIVALISIPIITNIINDFKWNIYIQNERTVLKVAKNYLALSENKLPINIGDTMEITLQELQDKNLIKPIKNPAGNNNCKGYIQVTKIDDKKYDYTSHINCFEDINSSAENNLIAHYKFNDFQESTSNLVLSPEFSGTSLGTGWGGWETSVLTFGSTEIYGRKTNYTNLTKRIAGTTNAIHQAIPNLVIGKPYTLSFYARINPDSSATTGIIRAYINSYVNYPISKEWTRIELTQTAAATSQTIHITQNSIDYDVQIVMVQLEEKPYATPFVVGNRNDTVSNYSSDNNNAPLQLATTPRWLYDQSSRNGVYKFNGINNVINCGNNSNLNMTDEISLSVWVNAGQQTSSHNGIVSKTASNYNGWEFRTTNVYNATNTSIQFRLNGDTGASNTVSLENGKWYHLTGTYDGNFTKLYVDGNLVDSKEYISSILTNSVDLQIGKLGYASLYFIGMIDDVRIYNRALSLEEIKLIYELENIRD